MSQQTAPEIRLSDPLLDRIDLHVEVPPVRVKDLEQIQEGESSTEIKKRVNAARKIQYQRFANNELVY